jgi:protein required for attachment to host cells
MAEPENTWIVVADGARARVFEERERLGPVRELTDHALHQSGEDRTHASHPKAAGQQSSGPGRHNVNEADPHGQAEDRFLHRVAHAVDQAAQSHAFGRLVLIAPPKALGVLKAALKPAAAGRLDLTDPHERTGEDAAAIRARLQHLRAS